MMQAIHIAFQRFDKTLQLANITDNIIQKTIILQSIYLNPTCIK